MANKENELVLNGWHLVSSGAALAGDKYWDSERGAWLPITVNHHTEASGYTALIRKDERPGA